MGQDFNVVIAVGVPTILGLVWLIRLEGRVNTHDVLHQGLRDDIQYIRERIDSFIAIADRRGDR